MIIWGIFWGAVLGSWFGGYGDFGPFVGGILGFFAGLSLRWAIRSAAIKALGCPIENEEQKSSSPICARIASTMRG